MLPWILLGGAVLYFLSKKADAEDKTKEVRDLGQAGPGLGWTPSGTYKDRNAVTWHIYEWEALSGGYQGIAGPGKYANQVFTAASYALLKTMIDAFASAIAGGKSVSNAYNAAIQSLGVPGT